MESTNKQVNYVHIEELFQGSRFSKAALTIENSFSARWTTQVCLRRRANKKLVEAVGARIFHLHEIVNIYMSVVFYTSLPCCYVRGMGVSSKPTFRHLFPVTLIRPQASCWSGSSCTATYPLDERYHNTKFRNLITVTTTISSFKVHAKHPEILRILSSRWDKSEDKKQHHLLTECETALDK